MSNFPLHDALATGSNVSVIERVLDSRRHANRLHVPGFGPFQPDELDANGNAALHYLAISEERDDEMQKLKALLDYYHEEHGSEAAAVLNVGTRPHRNTLLHLACLLRKRELLKYLLQCGMDNRVANAEGWSPIHFAVTTLEHRNVRIPVSPQLLDNLPTGSVRGSMTCAELLRELLQKDASPATYSYAAHVLTPVQLAARCLNLEALHVLWEFGFNFAPHPRAGQLLSRSTCRFVIEARDSEPALNCLNFLLQNRVHELGVGAGDSPLVHLAARQHAPRLLQAILEHIPLALADPGLDAAGAGPLHILATSVEASALHCVELLLARQYHHNSLANLVRFLRLKDSGGRRALDVCCQYKNTDVAKLILMATYEQDPSPDVSVHFWLRTDILSYVYSFIPVAMVPVLDESWRVQLEASKQKRDYLFDYSVLTGKPKSSAGGIGVFNPSIHRLVHQPFSVQKEVLLHALVQQYLGQHWTRGVRVFAYVSAVAKFLVLATYVFVMSACNCIPDSEAAPSERPSCCGLPSLAVMMVTVLLLAIKEGYQLVAIGLRQYFRSAQHVFQILFSVTALISLALALHDSWLEHLWLVSVAGILLAWVVVVLQLRTLPVFGLYISVFTQVSWKSFKILSLLGLPTFVIFSQVFQILLRDASGNGVFHTAGPVGVPVKLMAMMIGDVTFDEIMRNLYHANTVRYHATLFVFALFSFVATIILLNLMVAMAVNITHKVETNAKTEVARCQLEQICLWETFSPKFRRVTKLTTPRNSTLPTC